MAHSSARAGPSGSSAAHTAVSSETPNSAPSTDAGRTASRAAGLSRSTRERTRRSSACGTCWPAVALIRQTPCSRTRALVSSIEVSRSSRNSGLPSTLASTASRTSRSAAAPIERPGQLPLGLPAQWSEEDRADRRPGGGQAGHLGGLRVGVGTAGGQHEQAAARSQPGQVDGEAQRGRVGPVQVLQDENGRGRRHQARHQRAPGGERLPVELARAHPAQRRSRRQAHHAGQQRKQVIAPHRGQRPLQGRPDHRRGLVGCHSRPAGQQLLVEAVGRG